MCVQNFIKIGAGVWIADAHTYSYEELSERR